MDYPRETFVLVVAWLSMLILFVGQLIHVIRESRKGKS